MNYGIIGNCAYSALVEEGRISWLCWPRFDSSFVFGELLDKQRGGVFEVSAVDASKVEQEYVENTNVLRTVFHSPSGSFELIDFAPRFRLYDRYFKPTMLMRVLRPLAGSPQVRVRCEPTADYGRKEVSSWQASNHIEYTGLAAPMRLTTNIPLTYVSESRDFVLSSDRYLVLTYGDPLESGLEETCERFLERTTRYWRDWVKSGRIPRDYQKEVIRSALVLKLHQFEDTGALIAATTTSLPEFPGSGRTWDYRYCWLRDAYFTLNAFERLGQSAEMEKFMLYLRNLAETYDGALQPLYGVNGEAELVEQILDHLDGYEGNKPVRIGNQAYEHVQNDAYGEAILAVSRMLLDTRFVGSDGRGGVIQLVSRLLQQIEDRLLDPDAGLWELRGSQHLHTFTLLTHWAGARRAMEIGLANGEDELARRGEKVMAESRRVLMERCWNEELGALTQRADDPALDASALLALHFGFFEPDDPRALTHVEAIRDGLQVDGLLKRYDVEDDFGKQEAAFTVCSFWLVEALALVGKKDEACKLFERLLGYGNHLGLFSEDILPESGALSGNFPQTYSHVGLINAAFRLARDWE